MQQSRYQPLTGQKSTGESAVMRVVQTDACKNPLSRLTTLFLGDCFVQIQQQIRHHCHRGVSGGIDSLRTQ